MLSRIWNLRMLTLTLSRSQKEIACQKVNMISDLIIAYVRLRILVEIQASAFAATKLCPPLTSHQAAAVAL